MKFFALALMIMLVFPSVVFSQTLLPPKKPSQSLGRLERIPSPPNIDFEQRLEAQQSFDKILGQVSTPPSLPIVSSNIITPPQIPIRKQSFQQDLSNENNSQIPALINPNKSVMVVLGVPIPTRKPFTSFSSNSQAGNVKFLKAPEEKRLRYTTDNVEDRTASRINRQKQSRDSNVVRRNARPNDTYTGQNYERSFSNIAETNQKSPFKTGKLPRAEDLSTDDPVIVFFGEGTSVLEVGQVDVMTNDILNRLRRSSSKRVAIYGFAENEVGNKQKVDQLSYERAMVIGKFLSKNNIDHDRIGIQPMGSNTTISPKNRSDVIIY